MTVSVKSVLVSWTVCTSVLLFYEQQTRGICFYHCQIPDDHLAGCHVYPAADSSRRIVLRPEGAGLPDVDFLLYLHTQATDKCRAEVKSQSKEMQEISDVISGFHYQ